MTQPDSLSQLEDLFIITPSTGKIKELKWLSVNRLLTVVGLASAGRSTSVSSTRSPRSFSSQQQSDNSNKYTVALLSSILWPYSTSLPPLHTQLRIFNTLLQGLLPLVAVHPQSPNKVSNITMDILNSSFSIIIH